MQIDPNAKIFEDGFREEAPFIEDDCSKGEWINTSIYAILRNEWDKIATLD
jgi:RimJ/RimL family protein N-acetyltransferase